MFRGNQRRQSYNVAQRAQDERAREKDASANSQLSQLRRGDFFRLAAMPLLRIKAGHDCVSVLFRHDVHRQQVLPALRRRAGRSHARATVCFEMSALPD